MRDTIPIALVFSVLLGLEWWYRSRTARVAAAMFALLVLFFYQSSATAAARSVITLPPAERVQHALGTEYASGVATMYEAVGAEMMDKSNERMLGIAVLFWLALSPVLARSPGASGRMNRL